MPPFRTLELDANAQRSVGRLRLVAAAVCVLGAAWLVLIRPPGRGWICILGGALAALMWVGLWARGRRTLRRPEDHRLALDPDALRLSEGDSTEVVPWDEIASITADEERLVVLVATHAGTELAIEPRYGGLGLYELEQAMESAHREGCAPDPGSLQLRRSPEHDHG